MKNITHCDTVKLKIEQVNEVLSESPTTQELGIQTIPVSEVAKLKWILIKPYPVAAAASKGTIAFSQIYNSTAYGPGDEGRTSDITSVIKQRFVQDAITDPESAE